MDSQNKKIPIDIYQLVTDNVIALLNQGIIPWQKPWNDSGMPMNLLSKRPYRGINLWLLNALSYEKNYFLTWEQIKACGGSVKKDEKGHMVVFWKNIKKKPEELDKNGKPRTSPMLRYYKVFNVAQCVDIPTSLFPIVDEVLDPLDPVLECEAILNAMPDMPHISFVGKNQAYYHVDKDEITLPKMKHFRSSPLYYSTLFHELVHATGHEKRLNRKSLVERVPFGSPSYALEELIAEMGSAFLCRFCGIDVSIINDTVAYLDNWLSVLKHDKKFIIHASGSAQKAVDCILNRKDIETKDEENVIEESMVSS